MRLIHLDNVMIKTAMLINLLLLFFRNTTEETQNILPIHPEE